MIDVRRCTVAELEATPNLAAILAEYARESGMPELGNPNPQIATYRAMEAGGFFHPIGAFDGELLAGFILPIVIALPHYGVVAATVESWFVPAAERKKGIGLRLRNAAEDVAASLGAKAILISAPVDSVLARVMRGSPYRHSNDVFVRALA